MLSSSISLLSGSAIAHARTAIPDTAGRLKMLKEESIVWDETVEALTGLGAFEVLSVSTSPVFFLGFLPTQTPPPPKVERLRPLSRAEWALYFDVHRGLPKPIDPPPMSLSDSIIHVSHEESPKEFKGGLGKIVVPVMEIRRRIFAGGVDPEIRPEVWRFLYALYHWDSYSFRTYCHKAAKTEEYYRMKREHPAKGEDPDADMYRDAVVRVDKDVHRTDRGHPFYGQESISYCHTRIFTQRPVGVDLELPNMNKLRDILITYACRMADLASPILITLEGDERTRFGHKNQISAMTVSACGLTLQPYLPSKTHGPSSLHPLDLATLPTSSAVFRWFFVLFKREFAFADVLKLWEVLASGWGGDEFEYFVALAIMDEHRDAIYVNDLSGTIPLDPTLEAAELLYLRFRVRAASVGAGKLRLGEIVERVRDAEESARADIFGREAGGDGKKKTE
ncbi:rab-GTPase-TBC domain-containing protein [Chytridium lagenaria]|nr:rab-GTPase-TBC domain-containing protein [Chytridium lagenaria]